MSLEYKDIEDFFERCVDGSGLSFGRIPVPPTEKIERKKNMGDDFYKFFGHETFMFKGFGFLSEGNITPLQEVRNLEEKIKKYRELYINTKEYIAFLKKLHKEYDESCGVPRFDYEMDIQGKIRNMKKILNDAAKNIGDLRWKLKEAQRRYSEYERTIDKGNL